MKRLLLLLPLLFAHAADYQEIAKILRGQDDRLVRWDATDETFDAQEEHCDKIWEEAVLDDTIHGFDVLILCMVDHPENRAKLPETTKATVLKKLKQTRNDWELKSKAAHFIYTAVYGNKRNYKDLSAGIPDLANMILNPNAPPHAVMWAAAALQNLAASYCTKEHSRMDVRCDWDWMPDNPHKLELIEDQTVDIDGSANRKTMIGNAKLLDKLAEYVCKGPVAPGAPFPGDNATDVHRDDPQIAVWAVTGLLKNLAISDTSHKFLDAHIPCLCKMAISEDWLEADKGEELLHHMHASMPCWYEDDLPDEDDIALCIDDRWLSTDDKRTCEDFEGNDTEFCKTAVDGSGKKASNACCLCGGGVHRFTTEEL